MKRLLMFSFFLVCCFPFSILRAETGSTSQEILGPAKIIEAVKDLSSGKASGETNLSADPDQANLEKDRSIFASRQQQAPDERGKTWLGLFIRFLKNQEKNQ